MFKNFKKNAVRTLSATLALAGISGFASKSNGLKNTHAANFNVYTTNESGEETDIPEEIVIADEGTIEPGTVPVTPSTEEETIPNTSETINEEETPTDIPKTNNEELTEDTKINTSEEEITTEEENLENEEDSTLLEEKVKEPIVDSSNKMILKSIAPPVAPSTTLPYTPPTPENPFGDFTEWNGFILGDVTDCIDFEGSIAVGGNITSNRGLSVGHGVNGASPTNTSDISLLVGGNLNLNCYGSVIGQTATGTPSGNTYNLSNVTENTTTNGQYLTVDPNDYFAQNAALAKQINQNIASKQENATYTNNGYGSFEFTGNSNEPQLVYNVSENDFSSFNLNFNLQDNQTAIVNLTSDQAINFLNGSFSINGNKDNTYLRQNADRIVFNITNSSQVNMTSCELYGYFVAPNTSLIGDNANLCGHIILGSLEAKNGFEFHKDMGTKIPIVTPTPTPTTPPTPTPTTPPTPTPTTPPTPTPTTPPTPTPTTPPTPTPTTPPTPTPTTPPTQTPTTPPTPTPTTPPTPTPTTPPTPTPTTPPTPTPTPELKYEGEEEFAKTGDDSIDPTFIIIGASLLGMGLSTQFDNEESLNINNELTLKRKKKKN